MKQAFLFILSTFVAITSYAQTQPAVHINFNGGSLANQGTLGGAPAIYMGGNSAAADAVSLNGSKGIKVGFGSNLYAISLFIKPSSTFTNASGGKAIFTSKTGPGRLGAYLGSLFSAVSGEMLTMVKNTNAGSGDRLSYTADFNTMNTNWHHLLITYNSTIAKYNFYYDGTLYAITSAYNGNVPLLSADTDTLTFGLRNDNLYGWVGSMDEIKIYNSELSANDIADLNTSYLNYTKVEPIVHLDFENNLTNIGSLGGQAVDVSGAVIANNQSNHYLNADGTSGLKVSLANKSIGAYSVNFKSRNAITTTSSVQNLFASKDGPGIFGLYTGNVTSASSTEALSLIKNNASNQADRVTMNYFATSIDTTWHNLIINYESNMYSIYLDGVSVLTNFLYNGHPSLLNTNTDSVTLAIRNDMLYGFNGLMDDIQFFETAIPSHQIQELYQQMQTHATADVAINMEFNNNLNNTGNNGTTANSFNALTFDGCDNKALSCDGSNGVMTKVNAPLYAVSFNFKPSATISASTNGQALFTSKAGPGIYGLYLGNIGTGVTNELISLIYNTSSGSADKLSYYSLNGATINPDWNQMIIQYNAQSLTYNFYLNGTKLTTTYAYNGFPGLITTDSLLFGNRADNNYSYTGLIDNVKVYNQAVYDIQAQDIIAEMPAFLATQVNTVVKNIEACSGGSYYVGGATQTADGIYYDTIPTTTGCATITESHLSFVNTLHNQINIAICSGDSIYLQGAYQHIAGTYVDTLVSIAGCDSILSTVVNLNPVNTTNVSASICEGQTYTLPDNQIVTTANSYITHLTNQFGCDSTVIVDLIVNTIVHPLINNPSATICNTDAPIVLSSNITGGTYSGNGVNGNTFYPMVLGVNNNSLYNVYYTITDNNGCVGKDTVSFLINQCGGDFEQFLCYGLNNNTEDGSVYGLDGTVYGGVTSASNLTGTTNMAMHFDGTQGTFIMVNDPSNSAFTTIWDGLTLSAWVKPDAGYTGTGALISKWSNTIGGDQFIILYNGSTGKLTFAVGDGSHSASGVTSTGSLVSGSWNHVAVVWSPGGSHSIYINGVLDLNTTLSTFSNILSMASTPLIIGAQYNNNTRYFKGTLDNVKMFGRAFTGTEIADIYNINNECPVVTSIDNVSTVDVNALPNPFENELRVTSDNEISKIELISLDGKLLLSVTNTDKLNTSEIAIGIYFAKVYTNSEIQTIKVVKK